MTEHLTEPEIERYRRCEGEAAARQKIAAHLALCERCVERVYDAEHSTLAVKALAEAFLPAVDETPFHLSHAELKKYVAGHADKADQIICESHLDICEECSEELQSFSAQSLARSKPQPAAVESSWWSRTGWWANTPVRVAAAIALIGLLAFGVILMRRRSTRPAPQLAGDGPRATPEVSPVNSPKDSPAAPDTSQQSIVVRLNDNGKEISLDQQGKLAGVEQLDEPIQRIVKNVLTGEPLARPRVLDEVSAPKIELLGEQSSDNSFQLIGPRGKIITETRPTLSWKRLNGATSYVVSVFDSKFNPVVKSGSLSQPTWTVSTPLQRGQSFFWEVTAVKDGKEIVAPVAPAPRAQFKILEADKLSALQNLKRQQPVSHLALGLTYARLGLLKDAEAEFRKLLKENPDSEVVKKLLRTVQAWH